MEETIADIHDKLKDKETEAKELKSELETKDNEINELKFRLSTQSSLASSNLLSEGVGDSIDEQTGEIDQLIAKE